LSVILIFILSVLSRTVSVCGTGVGGTAVAVSVGVGGTAVGVTVGGEFVGVAGSTVGVDGTVVGVGGGVGVGAVVQAATKTAAAMSTII
jgi:hypothetical protein